jgi:hypothetical protein
MAEPKTQRAATMDERLDDLLDSFQATARLRGWNELIATVKVPAEFMAAFVTGRPELIRIAGARALTKEECAAMFDLVAVLMETNQELQTHAQQVAQLTHSWADNFKALHGIGERIERFANFRRSDADDEED